MNITLKSLRNSVFVIVLIVFAGCGGARPALKIQVSEQANPWTGLKLYNNPDNFQFAIVSDRTGGHRPGVFEDAVKKLNLLRPEFVISIGDLIEGATEDKAELNRQWNEFDDMVNKLQMPFFYVPGNHDISNAVMAKKWNQRLGPNYYHFVYRNVLFLCLNTEDGRFRSISDKQIEYFRDVLKANNDVRWTLVFMHQPVFKAGRDAPGERWADETTKTWNKLESLLADREYTVFAGHLHRYNKSTRKNRRYYVLATTGGDGGDNKADKCRFDHIVWVTMTDNGPILANLLLEGVLDDNPCPQ